MFTGVVGAALLALTTVAAQADCAAEIARLTTGGETSGGGLAKDGSLAPLEEASDTASDTDAAAMDTTAAADAAAATETAAAAGMNSAAPTDGASAEGGEGIAKDGSHVPLETAGGAQPGVAMSGADAQAQQEGEPTAAEQAAEGATDSQSTREVHIQAARDALAAGDEETCMKAIEAAESA
ncbi:hypothetical protein EYE42_04685 [Paracoccus subflavus]|uniref:Uncharacterized protein n=2 Tax=Paracoccus subflavus TaxID=2528244 RepID=A0A4Q9G410_9RHOB|nr:hypothetical protein EYE42_04685 [Paracoccus subflavus]